MPLALYVIIKILILRACVNSSNISYLTLSLIHMQCYTTAKQSRHLLTLEYVQIRICFVQWFSLESIIIYYIHIYFQKYLKLFYQRKISTKLGKFKEILYMFFQHE